MRKPVLVLCVALLSTLLVFCAAACNGDAPVQTIEFENAEDVILEHSYSTAEISVKVYPSDADSSDIALIADKEGYIEIGEATNYTAVGEDYCLVKFEISPLYNGTVTLTAVSEKYGISSQTNIKVTVSGKEDMPVTDESERAYLVGYGWSEAMIDSFVSVRSGAKSGRVSEISAVSGSEYTYLNEDDEVCKVVFDGETVTGLYDMDGVRQIYPAKNGVVIGNEDIDNNRVSLRIFSEDLVESYLNYPLTAEFSLFNWVYMLDAENSDMMYVSSTVEAQNAFGVPSEIPFSIKYRMDSAGEFTWTSAMIGDQYYYNI